MSTGMTFYFIDGMNAGRESKRLMRRHVMKGKNAGKAFHRPSRLALAEARRPGAVDGFYPQHARYCNQEGRYAYWMHLSARTAMGSIGNVSLPFSLPVEVMPKSLMVINRCKQGLIRLLRLLANCIDIPLGRLWPRCGTVISRPSATFAARYGPHVGTRLVLGRRR